MSDPVERILREDLRQCREGYVEACQRHHVDADRIAALELDLSASRDHCAELERDLAEATKHLSTSREVSAALERELAEARADAKGAGTVRMHLRGCERWHYPDSTPTAEMAKVVASNYLLLRGKIDQAQSDLAQARAELEAVRRERDFHATVVQAVEDVTGKNFHRDGLTPAQQVMEIKARLSRLEAARAKLAEKAGAFRSGINCLLCGAITDGHNKVGHATDCALAAALGENGEVG